MTKTTLRVPDPVMEALRERSQAEGRSVNDVAVEALQRGLGQDSPESAVRILGALLARAGAPFDAVQLGEERRRLGLRSGDLSADLHWVRGSE